VSGKKTQARRRSIDIERSVHHFIGVIRRCVSYQGDIVAELGSKTNGCLDASMRNEANDDDLMDAVPFELQI
jgi:hypothetical protein